MNQAKKLLLKASAKLELPADVLAGVPRIEILGKDRCCIEPQLGLLEYSENRVRIFTNLGDVHIIGSALRIKEMNSRRIVVSGKIQRVGYVEDPDE